MLSLLFNSLENNITQVTFLVFKIRIGFPSFRPKTWFKLRVFIFSRRDFVFQGTHTVLEQAAHAFGVISRRISWKEQRDGSALQ